MIEEINLDNQSSKDKNLAEKSGKSFSWPSFLSKKNLTIALGGLAIIGLGILSGWFLSGAGSLGQGGPTQTEVSQGQKAQKGEEFGVQDKSTFSDHAVGEVAEGGINGEGTHHLLREGGPSQTVFLFSSVLNLDDFVGRKVEVWGETFSAEKAGWLMDVGKLKVLD